MSTSGKASYEETKQLIDRLNEQHDNRPQSNKDLPTYNPEPDGPVVKISLSDALRDNHIRIVRRRYAKTTVREYLEQISDESLRRRYVAFYDSHSFFGKVCAGAKHHHHWVGGLNTHVSEMIGMLLDIKDLYRGDFEGKVTKDDIVIAAFLHDFAKIWTYEMIDEDDRERNPKKYHPQQTFKTTTGAFDILDEESKTLLELGRWSIVPTDMQWSAVLFAEGGWADSNWGPGRTTRTSETVMTRNPLAVLMHMGDMYSAMILGQSLV